MKKQILLNITVLFLSYSSFSQAISYSDPGQAFLRILLEKNNNEYTRIDNFKVSGSYYLFGNNNTGNAYDDKSSISNAVLNYDTYNQKIEVVNPSTNTKIEKFAKDIDSFQLEVKNEAKITTRYNFISSKIFNNPKPLFLLEVLKGNNFILYKNYKTGLKIVSSNYIQTDLREFELTYDYYYVNLNSADKKVVKLKTSKSGLKKEFSAFPSVVQAIDIDGFSATNQNSLTNIFLILNQ